MTSCGKIVCLKTVDNDEENEKVNVSACEIARILNICPKRVFCSDLFNGFSVKEEITDECIDKLKEAGIFVDIEEDYEVHSFMPEINPSEEQEKDQKEEQEQQEEKDENDLVNAQLFRNRSNDRYTEKIAWWTKTIGLFDSPTFQSNKDKEDAAQWNDIDVYILDTGLEKHPYLNVVEMKSFIEDEPEVHDMNGHGNNCGGLIGAKYRNWDKDDLIDVVGVCPNIRLFGYKVLNKDGSGSFSDIIAALEDIAIKNKRNPERKIVVNMSLGGFVGTPFYTTLDREVVNLVNKRNVHVVIASGNDNKDTTLYSPAKVREAFVVGAHDIHMNKSSFSNFGESVSIFAPGTDVRTTTINEGVTVTSGTSFACPILAGILAMILSKEKGNISSSDLKKKFLTYAQQKINFIPFGTTDSYIKVDKI